jgi:hypothetical protein
MRVFVYYNLHKECFSIKALEGPNKNKVIGYRDEVDLIDVEFKVSQAGRARVLREHKKNVHAGATGELIRPIVCSKELIEVTYNPYVNETFVNKKNKKPVTKALYALLTKKKIFIQVK